MISNNKIMYRTNEMTEQDKEICGQSKWISACNNVIFGQNNGDYGEVKPDTGCRNVIFGQSNGFFGLNNAYSGLNNEVSGVSNVDFGMNNDLSFTPHGCDLTPWPPLPGGEGVTIRTLIHINDFNTNLKSKCDDNNTRD